MSLQTLALSAPRTKNVLSLRQQIALQVNMLWQAGALAQMFPLAQRKTTGTQTVTLVALRPKLLTPPPRLVFRVLRERSVIQLREPSPCVRRASIWTNLRRPKCAKSAKRAKFAQMVLQDLTRQLILSRVLPTMKL